MDFFLEQLYQIQFLRDYLGPAGITFMNAVSQNRECETFSVK